MKDYFEFLVLRSERLTEIMRTLKELLPFVFQGKDIQAYTEMAKDLEIYSLDGVHYEITKFVWEPYGPIARFKFFLGRLLKKDFTATARIFGAYHLKATEERLPEEALVAKMTARHCEFVRKKFDEKSATPLLAFLQSAKTLSEARIALSALPFENDEKNDFYFTVPLDPEGEIGCAPSEECLEITAEGLGYDYDSAYPVNIYLLRQQKVFQLHKGPSSARPITDDDLKTLIDLLAKNELTPLKQADFKECHSLLSIIGLTASHDENLYP